MERKKAKVIMVRELADLKRLSESIDVDQNTVRDTCY